MTQPQSSELLVRAASLYLPICSPSRSHCTDGQFANASPVRFLPPHGTSCTAGPQPHRRASWMVELRRPHGNRRGNTRGPLAWVGAAVGGGPHPGDQLAPRGGRRAFALDLALMPLAAPVVTLNRTWIMGEVLAVASCLIPGLLLGRWTARLEHLNARATLQTIAFTGLLLFVVPSLVFTITGESWSPLLERPRWQLVLAVLAIAPAGAMAVSRYGSSPRTAAPLCRSTLPPDS